MFLKQLKEQNSPNKIIQFEMDASSPTIGFVNKAAGYLTSQMETAEITGNNFVSEIYFRVITTKQ